VVLDFGLAGKVESFDSEQKRKECVGTTGYIAPEQVNGAACDHRVDLFSLGVVLYKLATGQMPYPGSESFVLYYEALNNHQPEPPHVLNPAVPESLSKLILSLLASMPQQRPDSARQVRALLQQIQDDEVQKEVDKIGSAGELLKQGIIAFHDDGSPGGADQSTSLTSYFVAKSKSRFPIATLSLALLLGCMLAMGLWIYDSERDSERPVLSSTGPTLRHFDVRDKVKQTGIVKAPLINEASALIKSSKHPGIFYTLCDANNPSYVFAIDQEGKLHATLQLVGVQNFDWEALTSDGAGNLFVGDMGNNLQRFRERTIYRIAEPEQLPKESPQTPIKVSITGTWKYTFPVKPFDAESLFMDEEYFWIISKARNLGDTRLYRLPRSAEGKTTPLEETGKLPNEMVMISDAALSPDRKQLVVVNKFYAAFFPLPNGKVAEAIAAEPTYYEFDLNKVEGCCFDGEDLLMIAEDRKIYRLPR
jgi:hypothetical protein